MLHLAQDLNRVVSSCNDLTTSKNNYCYADDETHKTWQSVGCNTAHPIECVPYIETTTLMWCVGALKL